MFGAFSNELEISLHSAKTMEPLSARAEASRTNSSNLKKCELVDSRALPDMRAESTVETCEVVTSVETPDVAGTLEAARQAEESCVALTPREPGEVKELESNEVDSS